MTKGRVRTGSPAGEKRGGKSCPDAGRQDASQRRVNRARPIEQHEEAAKCQRRQCSVVAEQAGADDGLVGA